KHGDKNYEERPDRRGSGDRGFQRDRPQGQGRRDNKSRDGKDRDRSQGRHGSHDRDRRPAAPTTAPVVALEGWEVKFLPHPQGVEGLARQIKGAAKTYPLFDLARLVLEKSERYQVEFRPASASAPTLFQLQSDGSLWTKESEAITYALASQRAKFYRSETITVDPPKGNYTVIAVCGMSGVLLGPPNYHDFQDKIRKLHAKRYASIPFDVYKSRIRNERDEALIQKWKDEQSSREVFYPIDAASETPAESPVEAVAEAASEAPVETPTEVASDASAEAPVADAPVEASTEAAAETSAEPSVETPADAPAPEAPKGERFETVAQVEEHFRKHYAANVVVAVSGPVIVPGPAAINDSAPAVIALTRRTHDQLLRFPLPFAQILGERLNTKGLQIFKTHDNITCIGVARPHPLNRQANPVSERISAILDYLEAHTTTPRAEQWKALAELYPLSAEGPDNRESVMTADLIWLLHQGHVIDFAGRSLEVTRKREQPPAPKVIPKKTE
ncbi:MAG: hypothetical protein ABI443_08815, partial [Chthoniobacterales bacterium]